MKGLLVILCLSLVQDPSVGIDPGAAAALGAAEALRALRSGITEPRPRLLIFGDADHKTFLGCLTCSDLHPSSVNNRLSPYGNPLVPTSLLNMFSAYRNPASPQSACNDLASSPPVLVDPEGRFYGYLTTNELNPRRTRIKAALGWLDALCGGILR